MHTDSEYHILHLYGQGQLGKTHLATKVFPRLAKKKYGANCAIIDFKSRGQTAFDIFDKMIGQLSSPKYFSSYYNHYDEYLKQVLLSPKENETDEIIKARRLIPFFADGLDNLSDAMVLLIFDAINEANEKIADWLMNSVLVQIAKRTNLRVIVAGQSIPEASISLTTICRTEKLFPIDRDEPFMVYCREIDIDTDLEEKNIRECIQQSEYNPGFFVALLETKIQGLRGKNV